MKTQIPRNTSFFVSSPKLYLNHLIFLVVKYPHANYVLVTEGTAVTIQKKNILTKWLKVTSLIKGQQTSWTYGCDTQEHTACLLIPKPQMDKLILITRKSKQTQTEDSHKISSLCFQKYNLNWDNHWNVTSK